MITMDHSNITFTFSTKERAHSFVYCVYRILREYEKVTLADLCDLVGDDCYNYTANKTVWLRETLDRKTCPIYPAYNSFRNRWCVKFPEPDQYLACESTHHKSEQTPTPFIQNPTKTPTLLFEKPSKKQLKKQTKLKIVRYSLQFIDIFKRRKQR